MPVIELLPETSFDFSTLGSSVITADQVLVKGINVVPYRVGQLVARLHSTNLSSTQAFTLSLCPDMPSPDDPSTDFTTGAALATGLFTSSDAAGAMKLDNVAAPFTGFLRLIYSVRQQTTGGTSLLVTVSASLVVRE